MSPLPTSTKSSDFAWREKQALKTLATNLFPKVVTSFATEYGEVYAYGYSRTVEVLVKGNWEGIYGLNEYVT